MGEEETTLKGTPHTPKYFDQFLMVLLAAFILGLIFAR